jgi:1-aminocyclopropane-1-carboxylate deaminase
VPLSSNPLPRNLLREDVHARLRNAIVDGTLAPGEQLRDGDLAARLGVSRTPVREALLELARADSSAPSRRSTVVAPIDPAAVRDAQAVVAAMHALAVRVAVPHLTASDLDEMRAANADFAAAQRRGDLDGAMDADARFHAVPVARSGNTAAAGVLAQYEPVLQRAERLRFASHEGAASAERHERLIDLCADGDPEAPPRWLPRSGRPCRPRAPPPHSPPPSPNRTFHETARVRPLPADVRPEPAAARPPLRPPRRSAHLGQARRRQQRSRLRGNKVRKLEYIVPDVLASGADTIVSIGGYQSNHTRQVAAVAAHLGLKARLVQEKWVPWDDPRTTRSATSCSRMMGADSRLDDAGFDIGIRDSWKQALEEVEAAGGTRTRSRPGRASTASAARLRELGVRGGRAGEAARRLLRHDRRVHRHRIDPCRHDRRFRGARGAHRRQASGPRNRRVGHPREDPRPGGRIARHTAELIELGRERDDEIQVLEGWAGELYGIPVDSTMEAMALGAQLEAMITDPVYEGKSLAGLIDLVRSGDISKDSTVLYAHLGGQPAINAYHSLWDPSA